MWSILQNNPNTVHTHNKVRYFVSLNIFFTVVLSALAITPYLSRNVSPVINFLFFVLWVVTALISNGLKLKIDLNNKVVLWTVVWYIWQILMRFIGNSNIAWNNYIHRITLYAIPLIMIFVIYKYNNKEKSILGKAVFLIIAFNIISNIVLWIKNPNVFQNLNYVIEGAENRLTNAGSTSFVGICMFFSAICLIIFINTKRMWYKLASIFGTCISLFFMLRINPRAIASFILIAMTLGILLVSHGVWNKKSIIIYICILLLLTPMLIFLMIPLLEWGKSLFTSPEIQKKIEDVINVLKGTSLESFGNDSSLQARFLLSKASLTTFTSSISNFVFGVGENVHGDTVQELIAFGVGGHSELIDSLAEYGLIGGLIIYKFISAIIKYVSSLASSSKIKRQLIVVMTAFIIYSILNNSFFWDMFYVLMVLLPVVVVLLNSKMDKGQGDIKYD